MDIITVCHTEFGFVDNKTKAVIYDKKHVEGVKNGVLNLIKVAEKHGAKITFAVCPEVVDFFPKSTKHEIGLHIHPGWEEFYYKNFKWIVGDHYIKENCNIDKNSTALKDYTFSEQLEMIGKGKEYLKTKLNIDAKVFLAGRWSLNNDTIKALIKLGFSHDCSAYPVLKLGYLDWSKLSRMSMPYTPSAPDYQKKGNLPILITPVSRMFLTGAASPEDALKCGFPWLKACFKEYYRQGAPLFHIALHSPVMTDPYYISIMDNLFSFISKHENVNFKFASEVTEPPKTKLKTDILYYLFAFNKEIAKTILKKIISNVS